MAHSIEKIDVWAGVIKDQPGGLSAVLEPLSAAGANLEFVFARRSMRGTGIVFLAPVKGAAQIKAAKQAGLAKSKDVQALQIVCPDKRGLGALITRALADAGINVRGLAAVAVGRRTGLCIAFDAGKDAVKARRVLAKVLK